MPTQTVADALDELARGAEPGERLRFASLRLCAFAPLREISPKYGPRRPCTVRAELLSGAF
ncbi:MAG: hypothetical protein IT373_05500 [Polyangiaceae bacterium]|nr:hypothetical protein [Polyangiaceae bacterium]